MIVPRAGGGLAHFWRDNDHGDRWAEAAQPINAGNWSGVGLIHSNLGSLEIVGVMDEVLVHMQQSSPGGGWSDPIIIDTGLRDRPAFIQSSYGANGNFEVVAARADGGLSHYWRDNDSPDQSWSNSFTFNESMESQVTYDDVTTIQSSFSHSSFSARQEYNTCLSFPRCMGSAMGRA